MVRLGFVAGVTVICFALVWILGSLVDASNFLSAALVVSPMLAVYWAPDYFFRRWVDRNRPASDVTRLKAYLEAREDRVLFVASDGVDLPPLGTSQGPTFRRYRVRVRLATGAEVDRSIGVQVTDYFRPQIRDYDHPTRLRGDWE